MTDADLLARLRSELPAIVRQAMRDELAPLLASLQPALPGPQRRLLDALRAEFSDGPFASREVLRAAASPLRQHDELRAALAENRLHNAQVVGHALRNLPGVIRCKSERSAAVWAIEGVDPA